MNATERLIIGEINRRNCLCQANMFMSTRYNTEHSKGEASKSVTVLLHIFRYLLAESCQIDMT